MVQGGRPPTASVCQGGGVELPPKEASMEQATTIGLDIAKHVFHLHGADAAGHVLFRKRITRAKLLGFIAAQARCVVAMEACAGAHYWAREIAKLGHHVRLIAPVYVKPFIKRQKNDAADAEAICEAAQRPSMRFVTVKSEEQQAQRAVLDSNAEIPEDKRIVFRMGVNLGDVIIDGDDIYGDGVNIAARLEALAEPGGICVSRVVRDQIRDKLPYPFEDMGGQTVKNIGRPVHVYGMSAAGAASLPLGTAPVQQTAQRISIVILPFVNLSTDPEQEYFADGLTDDLTTDLAQTPECFVVSRSTAFTYKGKPIGTKQIGRELGVHYVLEGSLRWMDRQIQINAQLIDAET